MDRRQIKELLEKYYNGESSVSEEQLLKYYFNSGNIPDEFKAEQEIFRTFHEEKSSLPSGISFERLIDQAVSRDTESRHLNRQAFHIKRWQLVAAGFALLVALGTAYYFISRPSNNHLFSQDTYSDPVIAYTEAKKALIKISDNLNKGTERLQKLESFNYGMDKMNTLSLINLMHKN
jgi:hypothetical protein